MKKYFCFLCPTLLILLIACGEPISSPEGELSYVGRLETKSNENVPDLLIEYCKKAECTLIQNDSPPPGQTFFIWLEPSKNESLIVSDNMSKSGAVDFLWTQVESDHMSDTSKKFIGMLKSNEIKFKIRQSETWRCRPNQKLSFDCPREVKKYSPELDLFEVLDWD